MRLLILRRGLIMGVGSLSDQIGLTNSSSVKSFGANTLISIYKILSKSIVFNEPNNFSAYLIEVSEGL